MTKAVKHETNFIQDVNLLKRLPIVEDWGLPSVLTNEGTDEIFSLL